MSVAALIIGIVSLAVSGVAVLYSRQSVHQARRSADAAEKSVSIQEGETRRSMRADVRPLRWESRAARTGPQGLQLKNFGQAVASEVVGEVRNGDQFRRGEVVAISPGELSGLSTQLTEFYPPDIDQIVRPEQGQVAAKVTWKNADGSQEFNDWQLIESL